MRALVLCWVLATGCPAFAGNPYTDILRRNVFGLRPPPRPATEPARGPVPKVRLTGITTILKGKRALLKVEFPGKPLERPKEESYILTEGQRAGPIEVLEINERTAQVKVNNSGMITNITFEKITAAPAAPARPVPPAPKWPAIPFRPRYR